MNAVAHISSTSTSNTCLAAALSAVGIPLAPKPFVRVVGDGIRGERVVWFFEPQSEDGKFQTKELIQAWHDDAWHHCNPEHPFAYIKCAMLIGLVQQLAPLAVEAGKNVKDAILFVIAAFKSGQILDLVASSLKLGFAVGVNALVNGFRMAIEFFWNLITDGSMWKSLGTTMLGLVAGFGAALLNAFQTPIVYLQAGMEWVIANLMKGLLKIPGMADLLGFDENAVQGDFGKILQARKEQGAELFGFNFKDMAAQAESIMATGAPALAGRVAEAAKKAGESSTSELIDTTGLKESLRNVVGSIRDTMPKPDDATKTVQAAGKVAGAAGSPVAASTTARLEPIVTSMARVGGGGYATGALDAQRENNRLTQETNRLIRETNKHLAAGKTGKLTMAFG